LKLHRQGGEQNGACVAAFRLTYVQGAGAVFLLNVAFAMAVLDLISRADLASFVKMLPK
jgi:hypothetical protein